MVKFCTKLCTNSIHIALLKVIKFFFENEISGPSFWGLINPDWSLCNGGMSQSPINIKPQNVLFDPRLKDLLIGDAKVEIIIIVF